MWVAPRNGSRIAGVLGVICSLAGCQKGYLRAKDVDWVGADERVVIGELIVDDKSTTLGFLYFQDSEAFGNPEDASPLRGLTQEALEHGGIFSVRAEREPFYLASIGLRSSPKRGLNLGGAVQERTFEAFIRSYPFFEEEGRKDPEFHGKREMGTIAVNLEFPKAKARCEYVGTLHIKQGNVELIDNFELAKQRLASAVANCNLVSNLGKIRQR
ncbi:MAG: hypothetical protein SFV15_14320 [Polyangiaceae bacterium]|nr:hypothetical protein [Polyangiaceae bacterium]